MARDLLVCSALRRAQTVIRGQREEIDKPRRLNQVAQDCSRVVISARPELRLSRGLLRLREFFIDDLEAQLEGHGPAVVQL